MKVGQNEIGTTSKKKSIMGNLPVVEEDSDESEESSRSSKPGELRIKSVVKQPRVGSVLDSSNQESSSSYESHSSSSE